MHITEGVLAVTAQGRELLAAGWCATAVGTGVGLWRLDAERIPRAAVLAAAFFVISSIPLPLGITTEHLTLNGLMGLVLGWAAFPAVLVALVLQVMLFSLGGPTVLGLNTLIMALPAVVCSYAFGRLARSDRETAVFAAGFGAGMLAIVLSGLLNGAALSLAGQQFEWLGRLAALAHLPLAIVEAFVSGSVVVFLRKVRPELFGAAPLKIRYEVADG